MQHTRGMRGHTSPPPPGRPVLPASTLHIPAREGHQRAEAALVSRENCPTCTHKNYVCAQTILTSLLLRHQNQCIHPELPSGTPPSPPPELSAPARTMPLPRGGGGLGGDKMVVDKFWKPSLRPNVSFDCRCFALKCVHRSPFSDPPEPTRKQQHPSARKPQQGTLYHKFPSFLRSRTKTFPPPNVGPPKKTTPPHHSNTG